MIGALRTVLGVSALAPVLALSVWTTDAVAQDGLAACGNINVKAEAQCEVVAGVECTGQCEPINFVAACEGQCSGECTATADVTCVGDCEGECTGECNVSGGEFDCQANCEASCTGDCDAACSGTVDGSSGSAECAGACKARCSSDCEADCNVVPPEGTCESKCQATCQGRCEAVANAECQGTCSGTCTADLQGGCEVKCSDPEGALFCDGQYVDAGNNLEDCINALRTALQIEVTYSSSGSAGCQGNECTAEGEAAASCNCRTPANGSAPGSSSAVFAAVAALAAGAVRRRVQRRK